jgi:phosphopantothenoylcysteine decarboxylase/phosphopantothenate--cysteine ligase
MNCVVTAGPTYEELDEVRRLTNFSTGTLGSQLARFLVGRGHRVELLLGHYSTCRVDSGAQGQQTFTTTEDLANRLQRLSGGAVDAIFHAAAVSDFTFGKIWSRRDDGTLDELRSKKISTRGGAILAELKPTPKIIAQLRRWFPGTFLAGLKYELEGDRARAVSLGQAQIAENKTDVCVVNGGAYGEGFGVVSAGGACVHAADRDALFVLLEQRLQAAGKKGG